MRARAARAHIVPPPPLQLPQVRLAVAGAFHTQYMAPAAEKLQEALNNTAIVTPRIPVISNVDAAPHSDPAVIKAILAKQVRVFVCACVREGLVSWWTDGVCCVCACQRCVVILSGHLLFNLACVCSVVSVSSVLPALQLTSPVQWETSLQTLLEKGLTTSYEVGPGKVIAGIMKRLDKKANITNVIA